LVKTAGIDPVFWGSVHPDCNDRHDHTPPVGAVLDTMISTGNMPFASVDRGAMQFLLAEPAILVLPVLFPHS